MQGRIPEKFYLNIPHAGLDAHACFWVVLAIFCKKGYQLTLIFNNGTGLLFKGIVLGLVLFFGGAIFFGSGFLVGILLLCLSRLSWRYRYNRLVKRLNKLDKES